MSICPVADIRATIRSSPDESADDPLEPAAAAQNMRKRRPAVADGQGSTEAAGDRRTGGKREGGCRSFDHRCCEILRLMIDGLTLTAVFTPDENGWTMAQLAEWPAVVTCGPTVEEARSMLIDAAREMVASYRDEGREPPIGGGHVEQITIDLAA
jgi:predicted RNase H-like HicB family nuclease